MVSVRTLADEATAPKYAHIERERRWLMPAAPVGGAGVLIEDRYVTGTRMRLRRMIAPDGQVALKLTKKYDAADPLARPIVTTYLTQAEHDLLAALPAAAIVKRRHPLSAHGVGYSVDVFKGALAGLVLAEIEWGDDAGLRALPAPPSALREVSDDARYQGGALATNGIPEL